MPDVTMTDIQKAGIIRSLVRASDAIQDAFKQAAACIRTISGPVPTTLEELVLGRDIREKQA